MNSNLAPPMLGRLLFGTANRPALIGLLNIKKAPEWYA